MMKEKRMPQKYIFLVICKRNIICSFLLLSLSSMYGQFYKNFGVEVTGNFAITFNKGKFVNQTYYFNKNYKHIDTIYDQRPYTTANYNYKFTYTFFKKHTIGLKFGHNNTGMILDGKSTRIGENDGLGFFDYKNYHQEIEVSTIGLHYNYTFPYERNYFIIGLGIDRQKFNMNDVIIYFKNFASPNYSMQFSFGYDYIIYKQLSLIGRYFVNNAFVSNDPQSFKGIESTFSPLQLGLEIGLKNVF
jgi:hypothetical protein